MKHVSLLTAVLFFIAGCDGVSRVESTSVPMTFNSDQSVDSSPNEATRDSDVGTDSSEQVALNLSDAATSKVRTAMASVPGSTHLVVSVDVDDEKYCVGFHYNLNVEPNPSKSRFALLESNGIKLAIEKDDVKFLNGTTLDYATLASGTEGFVFRNPNENVSLPDELRQKQPQSSLDAQTEGQDSPR